MSIVGVIPVVLLALLPRVGPGSMAEPRAGRKPAAATLPVSRDETEELAPGKFLVAHRQLEDPNFTKTVVLLIRTGPKGAMGLIINRPSELKLTTLLPGIEDPGGRRGNVYVGGPVGREAVTMLLRSGRKLDASHHVFGSVYVSRSERLLRRLVRETGPRLTFRVFAGHAGWAPGQLEAEVARGDWHIRRADPDVVFDEAPHEVWRTLLPPDPNQSARATTFDRVEEASRAGLRLPQVSWGNRKVAEAQNYYIAAAVEERFDGEPASSLRYQGVQCSRPRGASGRKNGPGTSRCTRFARSRAESSN